MSTYLCANSSLGPSRPSKSRSTRPLLEFKVAMPLGFGSSLRLRNVDEKEFDSASVGTKSPLPSLHYQSLQH
ncbi:uncharacterized protein ARMOST_04285 [Armillaria ostoyae]|uniref:Uncharacterized protein n=1 Tax=Armillaria ostoyae TaxID=47428 RepID=A0A284QWX6_ARMOS|nr:uncharacterized protein ARMOST_04285 [Armillaria ostoyae]